MSTDVESSYEIVDGIKQIPSASDRTCKFDGVQDDSGGTSDPREVENSGLESESIGSEEEVDRRRVCVTTTPNQEKPNKDHRTWQKNTGEGEGRDRSGLSKACTHCGSTRHDDRGC